ncbi:MAG: LysM peptidoglycan-binding domain-containing protein [Candidatus Dormibacteraceae bacterium]
MTHAVVLVIVVTVSGFASVSRPHAAHLGIQTDANALVMNQGGEISDFYLGRFSTIIKPLAIPTSAPASHTPSVYTVSDGEDLTSIAAKFKLTVAQIRWSNPILTDTDFVTGGVKLTIPPTPGVVVAVHSGDTVQSLADTYKTDPESIIEYNRLRTDPNQLPDGLELVIPDGQGPALTIKVDAIPVPTRSSVFSNFVGSSYRATYGAPTGTFTPRGFSWGWCTWYVATRRNVTWLGDAGQWYGNAAAQGYPVGHTPLPGAIMVTWESGWGHVAYVESVNADGSFLVSEMNFRGFGVTSQRTIRPGGVPLIGFVYDK